MENGGENSISLEEKGGGADGEVSSAYIQVLSQVLVWVQSVFSEYANASLFQRSKV